MPRGRLRVYLGVAPGAGATHALLTESRRRAARGTDVVIGTVDTHGRPGLDELAAGLERVGSGEAVDVPALLARHPAVIVVDDLHRANPPGSRRGSRWQDVEDLLDAGVDVLAALDVRRIASLTDVVEQITRERPQYVVPDRVLQDADQLELVDISPQALRRRLAHGRLLPPEEVDATAAATFRPASLAALRELALGWAAGTIPRQHASWVGQVDPAAGEPPRPAPAETRERLLVGLSGGAGSERLLRRVARLTARNPGSELLAVHVLPGGTRPGSESPDADRLRGLAHDVGAGYQQVIGADVAASLLDVARAEQATQLVVGSPRPDVGRPMTPAVRRIRQVLRPGTAARLASAGGVDVLVVPSVAGPDRDAAAAAGALSPIRRVWGFVLALFLPAALTIGLKAAGPWSGLAVESLSFLLVVVLTALTGGLWPALLSAVVGSTLLNYFFIPPLHTFRVAEPHNVITLIVFVLVGGLVGAVVHRAAALAAHAARASAESQTLAAVAGEILRGEEALPTLLEQVRTAFGMTSASLLQRTTPTEPAGAMGEAAGDTDESGPPVTPRTSRPWRVLHRRGPAPPEHPEEADVRVAAGPGLVLALSGRTLAAADRTVLRAFAAQAEVLVERDRLARAAAVAERLRATERLRDALLAAVGHDLRTPLASATAAVSSLRSPDVAWSAQERDELLATAEESLQRLGRLVADLLDLSRLRAGVLTVVQQPVWLDEIVPPALDELGPTAGGVRLRIAPDVPAVLADAALVTRALVNLLGNALRHSPPDRAPTVSVSADAGHVELRVIDRGPGIPEADRARVFTPFQRLGDSDNRAGLGLGLALSRGLVEAMGGTLAAEDTPGGGLTMIMRLPAAPTPAQAVEPGQRERQALT